MSCDRVVLSLDDNHDLEVPERRISAFADQPGNALP